jgi:hypothetical protein
MCTLLTVITKLGRLGALHSANVLHTHVPPAATPTNHHANTDFYFLTRMESRWFEHAMSLVPSSMRHKGINPLDCDWNKRRSYCNIRQSKFIRVSFANFPFDIVA